MGASYHRSPKTTNEKRGNAAYRSMARETGLKIKGRLRTKGTSSRLACLLDDIEKGVKRPKKSYSAARKAKEREKGRLLAA